jgi:hypothetical protein
VTNDASGAQAPSCTNVHPFGTKRITARNHRGCQDSRKPVDSFVRRGRWVVAENEKNAPADSLESLRDMMPPGSTSRLSPFKPRPGRARCTPQEAA